VVRFYIYVLTLVTFALANGKEIKPERWNPREHPAYIEREISAFTAPSRHLGPRAEFGGLVESVLFDSGDLIKGPKDSMNPAVILDSSFAQIQKERAQIDVELAHSKVKRIEAQLKLAQRQFDFHLNEVKRIESLATSGKVRQSDLDEAKFSADSSRIQIQIEKSALELAQKEIAAAENNLKDAEEKLKRYVIKAPAGWIVQERLVEPGSYIQPGEIILQLADTRELAIKVRLSEREIDALEGQNPIDISFVQHPSFTAAARIHRIDVDHDPVTNKRLVELRILGEFAPAFSGGLEVSIKVNIPDPSGLVLVPREFVTLRLEQNYVTLDDKSELAIIPLRQRENWILISEEALPGDAILLRP
jgi:multidrug efflux pump subunit AcrA (membrane-fusion protein)